MNAFIFGTENEGILVFEGINVMDEDLLRNLVRADPETQVERIQEIEKLPEKRLLVMRAILRSSWKARWLEAVQTIRAIGYPANQEALPELLLDQVGDVNSEGRNEAIQTLLEMDQTVVRDGILNVLLDEGKTIPFWGSITEGICTMLSQIEKYYVLQLCPALIYLLGKPELADGFDRTTILDALERIPIEYAPYALPALIYCTTRSDLPYVKEQSYNVISRYDEHTLRLYQHFLLKSDRTTDDKGTN